MCSYCAFITYTDLQDLIPQFVAALAQEIRYAGRGNPGIPISTIFFGGGTPSLISPAQYQILFSALRESFDIQPDAEISLESNPNDLNPDYVRALRDIGFNRLSIGMQSSDPHILQLFEREHDTQQVVEAVTAAQQAGFNNISLDLIFGAPEQTLTSWRETLDQVIALKVQNISAYNLILEGNTPLTDAIDAGVLPRPDDDLAADMYDLMTDMLASTGFEQYEISNWALPGYESRHNMQYWYNEPYLGLGPGAHGFANGVRTIVMRYPQRYIEVLSRWDESDDMLAFPRTPAVSKAIEVDRESEMQETIMMGLRLVREGIRLDRFHRRFGVDLVELKRDAIDKHISYGLLAVDDERICLTSAGRLLSNAVIRDLI